MFFPAWLRGGVLVLTIIFCLVAADAAIAANVSCPERPDGYISDYAEVLGDVGQLEQKLDAFEQDTTNEVYVAVVDSLGEASAEDYTATLFNKWNIGKENLDNGVLFLVGVNDRRVHIKTGYGLGSFLNEEVTREIIDNEVTPAFSLGDFRGGIEKGVGAIIAAIRGDYHQDEEDDNSSGRWIFLVVLLLVIMTVVVVSINGDQKGRRKIGRRKTNNR
ncbi:MAG: TPM domain-containing protein [Parcubacteria group bacterium]|nr:TPM domain-containing protein [Parcubacteria group bacterium]